MTRPKLRVLLADDHILVREGLKQLIDEQRDMRVVGEASDGPEALRLCQRVEPDVALVDVSLPTWDGVRTVRTLRSACPGLKMVAVTRHDDESFVKRMMTAGADGYVLKQSPSGYLTNAIRAVIRGEQYVDPSISRVGTAAATSLAPASSTLTEPLTDIEVKVLRLVGTSHTSREISVELGLEVDSVQALKARAMAKLGLRSRVHLIDYARRNGWLEGSED